MYPIRVVLQATAGDEHVRHRLRTVLEQAGASASGRVDHVRIRVVDRRAEAIAFTVARCLHDAERHCLDLLTAQLEPDGRLAGLTLVSCRADFALTVGWMPTWALPSSTGTRRRPD